MDKMVNVTAVVDNKKTDEKVQYNKEILEAFAKGARNVFVAPAEEVHNIKWTPQKIDSQTMSKTSVIEVAQPLFSEAFEATIQWLASQGADFDSTINALKRQQSFWAKQTNIPADIRMAISQGFGEIVRKAGLSNKAYRKVKRRIRELNA